MYSDLNIPVIQMIFLSVTAKFSDQSEHNLPSSATTDSGGRGVELVEMGGGKAIH